MNEPVKASLDSIFKAHCYHTKNSAPIYSTQHLSILLACTQLTTYVSVHVGVGRYEEHGTIDLMMCGDFNHFAFTAGHVLRRALS